MKELIAYLNSIFPLSDAAMEFLAENLKRLEIPKRKLILKKGHVCHNIYFVEKGLLRCFYTKNDKEINSWFMKELDVIFSVESFLNQTPSYENIQTLEDSILHYITYAELQY